MPTVIDSKGATLRDVAIPAAFAGDVHGKENVMFRAVFREESNERSGTHSTLRRDEVRGGGKKPWRQKGTGRARQGSTRSPQWAHGGVVFGPKPRSYAVSLNKKERRLAMQAALTDRFTTDCVTLLAAENLELTKTAELAALLFGSAKAAKNGPRTLVVYSGTEAEQAGARLERVGRNLQCVEVTHTGALDVRDVLGYTRLVLTTAAFDELSSAFAEGK
ncbi:MAG TPA: 50S ribosomal protein L4 [Candidatus Acidoferrales bacterium]|nr:50S ribosomal protein L4 [Candidatus Acidoferrales bacterium]